MKSVFRRSAAALAAIATAVGVGSLTQSTVAASFGQKEVDQSKFIAVASPVDGGSAHQLLVLEQVASTRPCWSETNSTPIVVDPLLLDFNFEGICGRSTDSNGYSMRVNGQDMGLQYSLRVQKRDSDLVLVGVPFGGRGTPVEIGKANGFTPDFVKLNLNPGWRFTKRTYEGQTLGHVYLTYEGDLAGLPSGNSGQNPTTPAKFPDITGDIYQKEIESAVDMGFIAGFSEDNTFRPRATLTREQVVSIALESVDKLPNIDLNLPTQATARAFRDVDASRWSAAKIQFAQQNNIVSGYQDGTFRPTQPVTRAELMAIMRRTAEYAKSLQGQPTTLNGTQTPVAFSDTASHWANPLISEMSSYCGVASPMNEQGTAFYPNQAAQRNYATAATLRMLNCVKGEAAAPVQ